MNILLIGTVSVITVDGRQIVVCIILFVTLVIYHFFIFSIYLGYIERI